MNRTAKPHIIFAVTNDLSFDRRMIRICNSLTDSDMEVELIGRKNRNSREITKQRFKQSRLNCWFSKGKIFYFEYNLRLFIYLLFLKRIDAFCAIDLDTLGPVVVVGKLRGKKIIYDAHEYFHEVPELADRPISKSIWKNWGSWLIPKVDLAYTVGDELKKQFSKLYGINFYTIRNVPPSSEAEATYNADGKIILYQGMINEGRGVKEMILALEDFPDFKFWIVGEGDEYLKLKSWSSTLSWKSQIKFFGFVPPNNLREITSQATVGINLLENIGLSYYYSLANKAFDYIQQGIPSIQMNFPEYQNLQKQYNCFFLLDALDKGQIARILRKIVDEPHCLIELHEGAKKAAKILNWENESKHLIQLYKDLFKK